MTSLLLSNTNTESCPLGSFMHWTACLPAAYVQGPAPVQLQGMPGNAGRGAKASARGGRAHSWGLQVRYWSSALHRMWSKSSTATLKFKKQLLHGCSSASPLEFSPAKNGNWEPPDLGQVPRKWIRTFWVSTAWLSPHMYSSCLLLTVPPSPLTKFVCFPEPPEDGNLRQKGLL